MIWFLIKYRRTESDKGIFFFSFNPDRNSTIESLISIIEKSVLSNIYSNLTTAFRVIFQPVPSRDAAPSSSVMMWRGCRAVFPLTLHAGLTNCETLIIAVAMASGVSRRMNVPFCPSVVVSW